MGTKRAATDLVMLEEGTKRVKVKSERDAELVLSSIPPLASFAAPEIKHESKASSKPLSPLTTEQTIARQKNHKQTRKTKGSGTVTTHQGKNRITAHYDRGNGAVNLTFRRFSPRSWPSADAEQEVFLKLHAAYFFIEPTEEWGFLDRAIKLNKDLVGTDTPVKAVQPSFQYSVAVRPVGPSSFKLWQMRSRNQWSMS